MNSYIDSAVKRIRVYAFAVRGMSRRELAREAGLKPGTTRHIHAETWNPDLSTLRALERVIPDDWTFEETPKILTPNGKEPTDAQGKQA